MKRIISICLTVMCLASLVLGFVACSGEQTDSGPLSDATLDSLMFSLDGIIYTLPVHFSELEANGWSPYDPDNRFATDTLEPRDFDIWTLINGDQNVSVTIRNFSEEILPVSENYIAGLAALFRENILELHNVEFILPGNIMLGSTYEDVMAAYGEPRVRDTFEDDHRLRFYTGSRGNGLRLSITIDTESSLVIFINMQYWGD